MERNEHVAEPFRSVLNGFRFEDIDRLAGIKPEDFAETVSPEVEATAARMRTWRRNPDLPKLGEHVKMPAGPYEVFR